MQQANQSVEMSRHEMHVSRRLNKGCIERDALQRAMTERIWLIEHEMKEHEEKEQDVTLKTLVNDAM